jgi:aminoglycoside phosphotransferase (APT) family kinase protein
MDRNLAGEILKPYDSSGVAHMEDLKAGLKRNCFVRMNSGETFILRRWPGSQQVNKLEVVERLNKLECERYAYDVLREHEMPAPEVLAVECAHPLCDDPFMIMRPLPGERMGHVIEKHPEHAETFNRQRGRYLRKMHAIRFDHPGGFSKRGPEASRRTDYTDLDTFVVTALHSFTSETPDGGMLTRRTAERLNALIRERAAELVAPFIEEARFVHGDLHVGNVLAVVDKDGPRITGLLDTEYAGAGDCLQDFMKIEHLEIKSGQHPTRRRWLFDAYGTVPDVVRYKFRLLYLMTYTSYLKPEFLRSLDGVRLTDDMAWFPFPAEYP